MKSLTTILLLASIVSFAQTKKETPTTKIPVAVDTVLYDLGPVYEHITSRQDSIKRQFMEMERAKEAFLIGYFAGKNKLLTENDSLVWVSPKKVRLIKKKK